MPTSPFLAVDTTEMPWEERFSEHIGKAIYRKEFFSDPETGMLVRLVADPAGVINPNHTHPCGHGMYVLEGTWSRTAAHTDRARSSGSPKVKAWSMAAPTATSPASLSRISPFASTISGRNWLRYFELK